MRAHFVLYITTTLLTSALRSAEALQSARLLVAPRPPLARSARPQAVVEHLHLLPDAATLLDHASSLLEHGPSLTMAAASSSGEVAEVLKDGSIIIVPI